MTPPLSLVDSHNGSHATTLTASDEDESAYLRRAKIFHWVRVSISGIIFAISLAVIGCEVRSLRFYQQTNPFENWGLVLWPEKLDLRPTTALIACGSIIALLTLAYLIFSFLPSPHARIVLLNSLIAIVALSGLIAAIVSVAFTTVVTDPRVNNNDNVGETIHTWTCKWGYADGLDEEGRPVDATDGFGRLCRDTHASFALMCVLIVLEAALGVASLLGWWMEFGMERKRGVVVEVETGVMGARKQSRDEDHDGKSSLF
ncbi:hypothetical protein I7I51_05963 [Histoplasma capsulatum]|uniref:Uncharacterized protein n=1 Tax=Ajellomyces capsulatus TaxID=5037 RepID=A0A8A1MKL7_AJECA|nr:predicted protein [Histoplasma mississippiense (nom. inval.)]EDN05597.1 predicted protein [Histoplasma mississippiense (nom. inval.)]QSS65122.1 hypothetical protein I7I51_05963 [Histoplasma capsulatum]